MICDQQCIFLMLVEEQDILPFYKYQTVAKFQLTQIYYFLGIKQVSLFSLSNMLSSVASKKQAMTAKISYVQYKAPGPNNPIAYPIGIPRTPSPKEAHIIKLAVFFLDSLYPNSRGSAKQSANIEAKNMPLRNDPAKAANHWWPVMAAIKLMIHPPTMPIIKYFNLRETFMVTYIKIILNAVFVTQKVSLANAAQCKSATPSMTAQLETQLPYPTSWPIQSMQSMQMMASAVLLIGLAIQDLRSLPPPSGGVRNKQKNELTASTTPRMKQLRLPNNATKKGPTKPPIPKTVCKI